METENVVKILKMLQNEYSEAKYYLDFRNPVDLVCATILSAQCRDEVVNATTKKIYLDFKSAKDYAEASVEELEKYTSSITFYKNKAKNIKKAMEILDSEYNGKVPESTKELIKLPGIGKKTANAIMQNAFGVVEGVIVDTHVIRISQRLHWTNEKNPEKIEKDLMTLLPKEYWKELPHFLKSLGRDVCKAPTANCKECVLSKVCPSFIS
ncbi:endonuclease III [Candidatus Woesearchaeota archaeon]|jgi:endonuclease III|nr:endonuclease III [Candidatus Woesearchaeota archaeon]MBT4698174.1 endonuclease III [Candidatus Woesearchaeota archaeon]MBT4717602.1 endonuclease III [Candidatus Woesearchaeota archaeon]MBT7930313.1 endonuclease III [Candidatus Woesearchaeota archaeon]